MASPTAHESWMGAWMSVPAGALRVGGAGAAAPPHSQLIYWWSSIGSVVCCSLFFSLTQSCGGYFHGDPECSALCWAPADALEILGGLGGTDCRIVLLFTDAGDTCISVICNLICFMTQITYNCTLIKCRKNFHHYLMGLNIAKSSKGYSCLFFSRL